MVTEQQKSIVDCFVAYNPDDITANNTPVSVLAITFSPTEIIEALAAYAEETAGQVPRLEKIVGKHPLTYRYIAENS